MLTDIFADRYTNRVLWPEYTEAETRLLNQCFRIVAEQLFPYWIDGKESAAAKVKWTTIHDRLSTELGSTNWLRSTTATKPHGWANLMRNPASGL